MSAPVRCGPAPRARPPARPPLGFPGAFRLSTSRGVSCRAPPAGAEARGGPSCGAGAPSPGGHGAPCRGDGAPAAGSLRRRAVAGSGNGESPGAVPQRVRVRVRVRGEDTERTGAGVRRGRRLLRPERRRRRVWPGLPDLQRVCASPVAPPRRRWRGARAEVWGEPGEGPAPEGPDVVLRAFAAGRGSGGRGCPLSAPHAPSRCNRSPCRFPHPPPGPPPRRGFVSVVTAHRKLPPGSPSRSWASALLRFYAAF